MVSRFVGGAIGSLVGAYAWSHGCWPAVCAAALGMNALALVIHFVAKRREVSAFAAAGQGGLMVGRSVSVPWPDPHKRRGRGLTKPIPGPPPADRVRLGA
jgi:hypothetical protein